MVALWTFVKVPAFYKEPVDHKPPPLMIRGLFSFFHGSNDGQKVTSLIMLIPMGIVPTAYALNRAMPQTEVTHFIAVAHQAEAAPVAGSKGVAAPADARGVVTSYVQSHTLAATTLSAIAALTASIGDQVSVVAIWPPCPEVRRPTCVTTCTLRQKPYAFSTSRRSWPSRTHRRYIVGFS